MDFRISRAAVQGMDDETFFWALVEPVWPDMTVVDEVQHIATATPGQRALYAITLFSREVANGGLDQFFYNTSGEHASSVLDGFRLLGANDHAAALEQAMSIFPGGQAPVDREERIRALHAVPKKARKELFESIEERFYDEEQFWPMFRKYLTEHPSDFFVD